MQIDYEKLASIATDPTSRSTMAKDTSEVLASYLQILSNLIYASERLTESEMAMIISSMNRWVTKKDLSVKRSYGVGTIVQIIIAIRLGISTLPIFTGEKRCL